jgi:hypothetical protein
VDQPADYASKLSAGHSNLYESCADNGCSLDIHLYRHSYRYADSNGNFNRYGDSNSYANGNEHSVNRKSA